MKTVQIQFTPWDKIYDFDPGELDLKISDDVIVKTELGLELGEVLGFKESDNSKNKETDQEGQVLKPVLRKATTVDLEKITSESEKRKALKDCREILTKHKLPMKFIDAHFSFDGSKITFAFMADGRIDFRELVKDLTKNFNKNIRLYQVGIRDEARIMGDCGHCGRELCCKNHLKELTSITSDMADNQQISHRGSDRISGICGRLLCCLAYENEGYEEMSKKLPPLGARVNVDGQRGVVIGHSVLKQAVNVRLDEDKEGKISVIEVDINRHNKK